MGDEAAVHVPEGIFALEAAVVALDIATFLETRLSLGDGDVLQAETV
jgi:hypothetical protein